MIARAQGEAEVTHCHQYLRHHFVSITVITVVIFFIIIIIVTQNIYKFEIWTSLNNCHNYEDIANGTENNIQI